MYDLNNQRTVFEKMRNKHLPEEPYSTMYLDGFSPYEILETARNSLIRRNQEQKEETVAKEQSEPMNVKFKVEIKK